MKFFTIGFILAMIIVIALSAYSRTEMQFLETYRYGYCDALSSKFIRGAGCVKGDTVIYKFKN